MYQTRKVYLSLSNATNHADLLPSGNIFIGIKGTTDAFLRGIQCSSKYFAVTGTFQHSSLIAGGVVTSAGLISVKDGVIHTLSPLSGHYRYVHARVEFRLDL